MENYQPNSHKSKEQATTPKKDEDAKDDKKKVEPLDLTGSVVRRQKPLGTRFRERFIGGDDAKGVWNFVFEDVLVPAFKDTVTTAVTEAVERAVFGDVRTRRGSSRGPSHSGGGHVQYNRMSAPIQRANANVREDPRPSISREARARHDFDQFVLQHRVDAEEIIDRLFSILDQYDVVTVADLYESLGQSASFVDEKWGWYELKGADISRTKGGYLLDLPRPVELD